MNKTLAYVAGAVGSCLVIGGIATVYGIVSQKDSKNSYVSKNNVSTSVTSTYEKHYQKTVHPSGSNFLYDGLPEKEKQVIKKMQDEADLIFKDLSDIEKAAIEEYTGPHQIIDFINGKKFNSKQSNLFKKYIELISNLIKKSHLEEDICLYRGTSSVCLNGTLSKDEIARILNVTCETGVNDILDKLKGKVFNGNKSFVSTSAFYHVAIGKINRSRDEVGVFMKIHAKKGLNYLPIMQHSRWPGEKEVLLDRNLKLKITDAKLEINSDLLDGRTLCLECETLN
ncbi:MAG: ADP-ribosyltransferase [Clostridia bacterium]|nr:ADP-ribosyltransferase [Clostridia bacterium]